MVYHHNMPARPVQISVDEQLLQRIDEDPEVQEKGRSAFIRSAVECYLSAKARRQIEARLERAYAGQADVMLAEVEDLLDGQRWPSE
ncbi:MAG: ribbon-helix-helix protein, CopG family [Acidobacteria bacterium]|nr:ribbon-helix-helix protein, CopG family [Acidobacteriota bacterium]